MATPHCAGRDLTLPCGKTLQVQTLWRDSTGQNITVRLDFIRLNPTQQDATLR